MVNINLETLFLNKDSIIKLAMKRKYEKELEKVKHAQKVRKKILECSEVGAILTVNNITPLKN